MGASQEGEGQASMNMAASRRNRRAITALLLAALACVAFVAISTRLEVIRKAAKPPVAPPDPFLSILENDLTNSVSRQEAWKQTVGEHRAQECSRVKAFAARDAEISANFKAFFDKYQKKCLHLKFACKHNVKNMKIAKRYLEHSKVWLARSKALKCK